MSLTKSEQILLNKLFAKMNGVELDPKPYFQPIQVGDYLRKREGERRFVYRVIAYVDKVYYLVTESSHNKLANGETLKPAIETIHFRDTQNGVSAKKWEFASRKRTH